MSFVLDSSVTMAWTFSDEQTPAALAIRIRLLTESAIVPTIWPFEIANILTIGERRGRISSVDANRFLLDLQQSPIIPDPSPPLALPAVLVALTRKSGLTAYDAAYVELAHRMGLPLATQDQQLRQAATQLGVQIL